ncbi:MAG: bifunctional diaminohydroxyphosphoribosylaminopyrimidine deaminase/5-amino-6-(5-phosphoribosylamino)uracil reductase RibD [Candidatus Latescibacteria bacterium]|nr:bifunctional diaminohydroxyphosphoribosylaminopyrimidine deaminase/5-amino-6-(5-phosphoribosylamino)uracil reductase RibD [Candidatus Latescibacterota bacterium]
MPISKQDLSFMQRALTLAERGRGRTSPNPMVGAVIVRDGHIIGEGYHQKAGGPHAEPNAIRAAGTRTRGSTMYVTLEPCSHHGRTPPCADAIIEAGISRVIVAMTDPDKRVTGAGIDRMREADIAVGVGLLETETRHLNRSYIHHRQTGEPFTLLKMAQTLDGRIATKTGHSQWITGEEARRHGHQLRSEADAVLVGIGTVLADNPQLTVRHVEGRQPRRIILDSGARTPISSHVLNGEAPTTICVTDAAPQDRIKSLLDAGTEMLVLPTDSDNHIDLNALKRELGAQQILALMIEGGSQIATAFLKARAVEQITCFIAPLIMGAGLEVVGNLDTTDVSQAIRLHKTKIEQLGNDFLLTGQPIYAPPITTSPHHHITTY